MFLLYISMCVRMFKVCEFEVICLKLCISSVYRSMVCSSVSIWNTCMYMMCLYLFLDVCAYMVQAWWQKNASVTVNRMCAPVHTCGRCLKLCANTLYNGALPLCNLPYPSWPALNFSITGEMYPQILHKTKTSKFFNGSQKTNCESFQVYWEMLIGKATGDGGKKWCCFWHFLQSVWVSIEPCLLGAQGHQTLADVFLDYLLSFLQGKGIEHLQLTSSSAVPGFLNGHCSRERKYTGILLNCP